MNGAPSTLRSDVYSLGMTVTEVCLNCRYKDAVEQSNGKPFSLLEHNKAFARFVPVLRCTLESDPQLRYANVAEFARAFADRRVSREPDPRPPTLPPTISHRHALRAERANRVGVFFVLIILAVLVVAMFIFINMQSGVV
jgi:hypothetical protein